MSFYFNKVSHFNKAKVSLGQTFILKQLDHMTPLYLIFYYNICTDLYLLKRGYDRKKNEVSYDSYDKTIVGQFPDRTLLRLTLPRRQIPDWNFPDGHFPDGHFPERTIPRPDSSPKDTSPTGHFPTKTFPRTDISSTMTYFQISAFFSETFCWS